MIPSKSITLKKYKGDILTGHLMMKELYPDGVVYYNAKHIEEADSETITDISKPAIS